MEITKFLMLLLYCFVLLIASISSNKAESEYCDCEPDIVIGSKINIFNPPGDSIHGIQTIIPDLTEITSKIDAEEFIYDQNPELKKYVMKLQEILNQFDDPVDLAQVIYGLSQEPSLNKGIWFRAAISCLAHREDVNLFTMPRLFEIAPSMSFSQNTMKLLKEQSQLPQALRKCVVVDENSGSDNGPENALWYFREDPMVNSNHWFWHIYYPVNGASQQADRRGELFYAFHHSLLSRYQTERLCNSLDPITPLGLEKGIIVPEGYRSHLTETNSRRNWTDRPDNIQLQDRITSPSFNFPIEEPISYRQRILVAINSKSFLLPNNAQLALDNIQGIDILGNAIESSIYSKNPGYYGRSGYHNIGHMFWGTIVNPNNPTGRFPPGVMLDTATAMRDVIFYRWHYHIDSIFQQHKDTLQPYQPAEGELQLSWPKIAFQKIEVRGRMSTVANRLQTFWSTTNYTLQNGLDFRKGEEVEVCVKHLNHEAFRYQFLIENNLRSTQRAVIRIFLAPRFNETGKRYSMIDQRKLFFVLDTFSATLRPGRNNITRESVDSTLTILNNSPPRDQDCNCGWPDHLLLPKGTQSGMVFDLFGMVTQETTTSIPSSRNFTEEPPFKNSTELPPKEFGTKQSSSGQPCLDAYLYCGVLRAKYPDIHPMGYPFDRLPFSIQQGQNSPIVSNLDEYIQPNTNMATATISIYHLNQVISP